MTDKLTDEQLAELKRLRKFEADALPVLDAYEHMHTRAVRAEAEVERMRALELERSDALTRITELGQEIDAHD